MGTTYRGTFENRNLTFVVHPLCLFSPREFLVLHLDPFWCGGGFPREEVGVKKFYVCPSTETWETCRDIPEVGGCSKSGKVVYFLSSLRAQTAKTLICAKKGGVPLDSRKSAKSADKCRKPHFLHKSAKKKKKRCGFPHFLALFLESAATCAD